MRGENTSFEKDLWMGITPSGEGERDSAGQSPVGGARCEESRGFVVGERERTRGEEEPVDGVVSVML